MVVVMRVDPEKGESSVNTDRVVGSGWMHERRKGHGRAGSVWVPAGERSGGRDVGKGLTCLWTLGGRRNYLVAGYGYGV